MKWIVFLLVYSLLSKVSFAQMPGVEFISSDTALQSAFHRAKQMALHYKGRPGDPVGPWYESALPPRAAFCMRDISHQSIPAEVLGMGDANRNMFTLFVKNISASKDWCSFWEINKYAKPAPEDYRNDTAFWYNLNANFDLMNACWNLYLWTGDTIYISNPTFKNFYERSVSDYISSWVLEPDSLLTRPSYPNAGSSFQIGDAFHRCRGLPSYSEGVPDLKIGADLIAAIFKGLLVYSQMLSFCHQDEDAKAYREKAILYQKQIDRHWWDDAAGLYNTFYSNKGQFGKNEGETFLLWFDAVTDSVRKANTIHHLLSEKWNVENMSYFPFLFYQNGYWKEAKDYMLLLTDPSTKRREYPEVSYGVILGFVKGLMGIQPDSRTNQVTTLYKTTDNEWSTLKNVSLLGTVVTVTHSPDQTEFTNEGTKTVIWRAGFYGHHNEIIVDGKKQKTEVGRDEAGKEFSYADIKVAPGKMQRAFMSGGLSRPSGKKF